VGRTRQGRRGGRRLERSHQQDAFGVRWPKARLQAENFIELREDVVTER
jgi:hypothetical protein